MWLRVRTRAASLRCMWFRGAICRTVGGLLAVTILVAGRNVAADEAPDRVVQYQKDALTVRVTHVPVDEVLTQLGQQSGAEIRGEVRDRHEVTAEFEDVPLPEALHRLLGEQNFALIYGDGGRLKAVRLLGGPLAAPAPAAAAPPTAPPAASSPASLPALTGLFEARPPVPIQGRLSEVLGSPLATFPQLGDVALHSDDVLLRTEAIRVALQAIEADPEFKAAVISGVTSINNADLASLIRGIAGAHSDELVLRVITLARATELRAKASSVLQELRTQPAAAPPAVPPQPGA